MGFCKGFTALVVLFTIFGAGCSKFNAPMAPLCVMATTPTPGRTPQPFTSSAYIAIGDSITAGYGASTPSTNWVSLFNDYLTKWYPGVYTWNLGDPGTGTIQIVSDIMPIIPGWLASTNLKLKFVTVDIGTNELLHNSLDVRVDGAVYGCTAAEGVSFSYLFKNRLENQIVKPLQAMGDSTTKFALATIYDPSDGAGYSAVTYCGPAYNIAGVPQCHWDDAEQVFAAYNQRIAEVAQETNCQLVDIHKRFLGNAYNFIHAPIYNDIHPNDAGHAAIASEFEKYF